MKTTTLNRIRQHSPCKPGWTKLLAYLGKTEADDEPLSFQTILDSNGWRDAVWCMRAEPQWEAEWRLFAVWCCRRVQHLMRDIGSLEAVNAAEGYAKGMVTEEQLRVAAVHAAYAAAASAADADAHAAHAAAHAAHAAHAHAHAADAAYTTELSRIFNL